MHVNNNNNNNDNDNDNDNDDDNEIAPSPRSSTASPNPSAHSDSRDNDTAPWRPLPRTTFRSIEYPGPVAQPESILRVINQADIDECFNGGLGDASRHLEMRYRHAERSSIPVRGSRVVSQKLLVKVVKRRKRVIGATTDHDGGEEGVFTADIVGSIPQTVRFRSMADWQYKPPAEGPTAQLLKSLVDLDYDAILEYSVPPLHEEYVEPVTPRQSDEARPSFPFRSIMDLQATPVAGARHLPHLFSFNMGPQTVEEKVWDDNAQEYKSRYVNKSRAIGFASIVIGHGRPVPLGPEDIVKEKIPKLDQRIYNRLIELLQRRPVWMRHSILAQFSDADQHTIQSSKVYFPAVGYTFGAGPYWKTVVRFGYDPCSSPEAHIYQRVYLYLDVKRSRNNVLNTVDSDDEEESKRAPFWWEFEQERLIAEGKRAPLDSTKGYIFDGEILHRNKPDYQLIDIHDPIIAQITYDPLNLVDVCDQQWGWYRPQAITLIKNLLRVRYTHLRDTNEPAPEEAGQDLIDAYERMVDEGIEVDEAD